MSLKDKLEIGLKPDAKYRKDNLPEFQQDDPDCEAAAQPTDTPDARQARDRCDTNEPDPADLPDESEEGRRPEPEEAPSKRRSGRQKG